MTPVTVIEPNNRKNNKKKVIKVITFTEHKIDDSQRIIKKKN